jgi:predicted nucleic acid-binding protein
MTITLENHQLEETTAACSHSSRARPSVACVWLIRQAGTDLIPLDGPDATAVGLLLARTGTADIVDAHVAICAQRAGQAVVTSDPDDLRRIAPELHFVVV